jgi:hypothetical protein
MPYKQLTVDDLPKNPQPNQLFRLPVDTLGPAKSMISIQYNNKLIGHASELQTKPASCLVLQSYTIKPLLRTQQLTTITTLVYYSILIYKPEHGWIGHTTHEQPTVVDTLTGQIDDISLSENLPHIYLYNYIHLSMR